MNWPTKLILLAFLLLSFVGCNQSRDRRTPLKNFDDELAVQNEINRNNAGDTEAFTATDSALPAGFSHCKFGSEPFSKRDGFLGEVDLCQSKTNPLQVLLRAKQDFIQRSLCVIPTTRDMGGSSFYIGDAYCDIVNADKYYVINLTVFNGYQSLPLNGAMVMYMDKVSQYEACINAIEPSKTQLCQEFGMNGGYIDFNFTSY